MGGLGGAIPEFHRKKPRPHNWPSISEKPDPFRKHPILQIVVSFQLFAVTVATQQQKTCSKMTGTLFLG